MAVSNISSTTAQRLKTPTLKPVSAPAPTSSKSASKSDSSEPATINRGSRQPTPAAPYSASSVRKTAANAPLAKPSEPVKTNPSEPVKAKSPEVKEPQAKVPDTKATPIPKTPELKAPDPKATAKTPEVKAPAATTRT